MKDDQLDIVRNTLSLFNKNNVRNDSAGEGTFGASRAGGKRVHKGTDFLINPGEPVPSPVSGKVTKVGFTYASDLSFRYVQVTDEKGNNHRLFYTLPGEGVKIGADIKEGDSLGSAQDIAAKHGHGMKNHIHYEILDNNDTAISEDQFKLSEMKDQLNRVGRPFDENS